METCEAFAIFTISLMIAMYVFFSPIGIAESAGGYSPLSVVFMIGSLVLLGAVFWFFKRTETRRERVKAGPISPKVTQLHK
ncbi:symporter YidK [Halobacillus sp. BAB-2008]|nr:symporter YidK [Halobacillus sp. BAB-2008]